ncbi:MAG: hypothetical protein IJM65_06830 [Bacteroidales bacterium]|nr:hypothetical protein [Bacteroidales bacterium]
MKRLVTTILLLSLVWAGETLRAQQTADGKKPWCSYAALETRVDFDMQLIDRRNDRFSSAFQGKYLNFQMDGWLAPKASYHWRQRINAGNMGFSTTFFEGTDWMYLQWDFAPRFSITAGKEVVAIGGWEYDLAPISMYFWSEFWNNVNCYEMGISLHYRTEHSHLQAQVTNSPYIKTKMANLYAYNLIWYGDFNWFKPIWSTNLVEFEHGKFINYIALGNKFDFGKSYLYIDVMNRACDRQDRFFFQDYTLIVEAKRQVTDRLNLFAKGGIDRHERNEIEGFYFDEIPPDPYDWDLYVPAGTYYQYVGMGGEYYPLIGKNTIRLHAFALMKSGDNWPLTFQANLGVIWKLGIK